MTAAARAASVAPGDGDAAVGLLQRGGVVDAVAGHADDVAALLEDVDDVELVLGEDLGEAVGVLDGRRLPPRSLRASTSPRPEASRMLVPSPSFVAVSWAIASASPVTILTCTPSSPGGGDGRLGVFARRVKQGQHPEQLPVAVAVGAGHPQRPKAARRELVDRLIDAAFTCAGVGGELRRSPAARPWSP